jgi:hypothetical protein
MHEHTTIPCPHQQLLTEGSFTEVVRQGAGRVLGLLPTSVRETRFSLAYSHP